MNVELEGERVPQYLGDATQWKSREFLDASAMQHVTTLSTTGEAMD